MPWTGTDDFTDASRRHLADAEVLFDAGRWDGAVHLAGFSAECALKSALRRSLGPGFIGPDLGHDLSGLTGWGWSWTVAVRGERDLHRVVDAIEGTALAHRHPHRRYWARGWPEAEAEAAMRDARRLVSRCVLDAILDRGEPWGSD